MGRTTETKNGGFSTDLQDYLVLQQVVRGFGLRMFGYSRSYGEIIIETDEGQKRLYRLAGNADEYRFLCTAADYLRGQGFSRLPKAAWSPLGDPFFAVGEDRFVLHDWVKGAPVDLDNVCQLTQAVEMLAWFHRCSWGFRAEAAPAGRVVWGSWPRRFNDCLADLYRFEEQAGGDEGRDRFARTYLDGFQATAAAAIRARDEIEALPYGEIVAGEVERGGLCCGFAREKIVRRDDGALFLTDFDDIIMESRLDDLAGFLLEESRGEIERALFILQVYHGVCPLTVTEVKCIETHLMFPFEVWQAALNGFTGSDGDRHQLKKAFKRAAGRRNLADALDRADLSFLLGGNPAYNLGYVNLPEVPAGKSWDQPAVVPPANPWWTAPDTTPAPTPESFGDYDMSGTVFDLGDREGMGAEGYWSDPSLFAYAVEQGPGVSEPVECEGWQPGAVEPQPLADENEDRGETLAAVEASSAPPETPAPIEPAAAVPAVLSWRAFPAPLKK